MHVVVKSAQIAQPALNAQIIIVWVVTYVWGVQSDVKIVQLIYLNASSVIHPILDWLDPNA